MSPPLLFLVRFLAVAGLLFGCWPWISPLYIGGILPMANALFAAAALPVQLELHETVLVFAYEHSAGSMLRLQMHSYESVYFNVIPLVALFATAPDKRFFWKLAWVGAALFAPVGHALSQSTGQFPRCAVGLHTLHGPNPFARELGRWVGSALSR